MAIETTRQVGWTLNDASARGEILNTLLYQGLRMATDLLERREGIRVFDWFDNRTDAAMRRPGREHAYWRMLLVQGIAGSALPQLREELTEVHTEALDRLSRAPLPEWPEDLLEERRRIGMLTVPTAMEPGVGQIWIPQEYSLTGQQVVEQPGPIF